MSLAVELVGGLSSQGGGHGSILECIVNPGEKRGIAKIVNHREGFAYPELERTPLAEYLPHYYGNHVIDGKEYLVIENLTSGFSSPSIMDLKVGTRHYDLSASKEKIEGQIEKTKSTTSFTLGVRLIDGKMRKNSKTYQAWNRKDALNFSKEELKECLLSFLPTEWLRNQFIQQVQAFRSSFSKTLEIFPGFRVYASSLLLIYDGDADLNNCELRVKFIDFAHMYLDIRSEDADINNPEYNDNVILGCESLITLVQNK